jgi:hypothetical protein
MMKKNLFGMMTLIVGIMLVFSFVACDDGTGDNNNDDPNKVATPTASPAGGSYSTAQTVTLSTTTSGASIRYTTNGIDPTSTSGTLVSGSISVTATTTIKAIAYKEGMTDSGILTATYTISGSGNGELGAWSFPENLKVTYTYLGDPNTVIKIGNSYYRYQEVVGNGEVHQWYLKNTGTDSWIFYDKITLNGSWETTSYMQGLTLASYLQTYFYTRMLADRAGLTRQPVTGYDTVAGRPVEIRKNSTGDKSFYIDMQYNLVLKTVSTLSSTGTSFEVTSWDETVTDFGGVSLPN